MKFETRNLKFDTGPDPALGLTRNLTFAGFINLRGFFASFTRRSFREGGTQDA
jgi:hypothetical protein